MSAEEAEALVTLPVYSLMKWRGLQSREGSLSCGRFLPRRRRRAEVAGEVSLDAAVAALTAAIEDEDLKVERYQYKGLVTQVVDE